MKRIHPPLGAFFNFAYFSKHLFILYRYIFSSINSVAVFFLLQVDILTTAPAGDDALPVPEGDLLASTPSPCAATAAASADGSKSGPDLSEFDPEFVPSSGTGGEDLTSNVAILSGEFSKPAEEEEDEFDAAFDALAQESVTKSKLEDLERQFEEDGLDDIFDTTKADKVLQLASLLDKVEDRDDEEEDKEEDKEEELDFEDPFDTTAYEHITGAVEEDLEFESLAKREPKEDGGNDEEGGSSKNKDTEVVPIQDAGGFAFNAPAVKVNDTEDDDWAAFAEDGTAIKKKPSR